MDCKKSASENYCRKGRASRLIASREVYMKIFAGVTVWQRQGLGVYRGGLLSFFLVDGP